MTTELPSPKVQLTTTLAAARGLLLPNDYRYLAKRYGGMKRCGADTPLCLWQISKAQIPLLVVLLLGSRARWPSAAVARLMAADFAAVALRVLAARLPRETAPHRAIEVAWAYGRGQANAVDLQDVHAAVRDAIARQPNVTSASATAEWHALEAVRCAVEPFALPGDVVYYAAMHANIALQRWWGLRPAAWVVRNAVADVERALGVWTETKALKPVEMDMARVLHARYQVELNNRLDELERNDLADTEHAQRAIFDRYVEPVDPQYRALAEART